MSGIGTPHHNAYLATITKLQKHLPLGDTAKPFLELAGEIAQRMIEVGYEMTERGLIGDDCPSSFQVA